VNTGVSAGQLLAQDNLRAIGALVALALRGPGPDRDPLRPCEPFKHGQQPAVALASDRLTRLPLAAALRPSATSNTDTARNRTLCPFVAAYLLRSWLAGSRPLA
jgi:hypothetical protein